MVDSPPLQELLKVGAGKLRSTVSAETKENATTSLKYLQKILIVLEAMVSLWQGMTTGHLESQSAITGNDFPETAKKSAETDSKGQFGWSSLWKGSCWRLGSKTWHDLQVLTVLIMSESMPEQKTACRALHFVAFTLLWLL